MKYYKFALVTLMVLAATTVVAQQDPGDPGMPDSISFSGTGLVGGESLPIALNLTNDEAIEAIAMHIVVESNIDGGAATYDSVTFVGRLSDPSTMGWRQAMPLDNNHDDGVDTLALLVQAQFPQSATLPQGSGAIVNLWYTGELPGNIQVTTHDPAMTRIFPEGTPFGNSGYFLPTVVPAVFHVAGGGLCIFRGEPEVLRFESEGIALGVSSPVAISLFNDDPIHSFNFKIELASIDGGDVQYDSGRFVGRLSDPNVVALRGIAPQEPDGGLSSRIIVFGYNPYGIPIPVGDGPLVELFFTGLTEGQVHIGSYTLAGGGTVYQTTITPSCEGGSYGSGLVPDILTAAVDVGTVLVPAPAFASLQDLSEPFEPGSLIQFDVQAFSPVGNPVDVALVSFTTYDDVSVEPAASPLLVGGQPETFFWIPDAADIGIWLATFEASDQITGRITTASTTIQVVTGQSFMLSFEMTETPNTPNVTGIVHGDFDEDGAPELLMSLDAWVTGKSLGVYDYTSLGILEEVFSLNEDLPGGGIVQGYFNDDNHLDAATCIFNDLWTLHGNGNNSFSVFDATEPRPMGAFKGGSLTNFNGDAYLDYVGLGSIEGVAVYEGSAESGFSRVLTLAVGSQPFSINSADFNGDGLDDLAVGTAAGLEVYVNSGLGGYDLAASYNQSSAAFDIDVTSQGSDFNNDGIFDLCLASPSIGGITSQLMVYYGVGDGTFNQQLTRTVNGHIVANRAGDFNGDGDLDIAFINASENYLAIAFGDGLGSFPNELRCSINDFPPQQMDCLDIDVDGDLDIVVSAFQLNPMNLNSSFYLFRNNLNPVTSINAPLSVTILDNTNLALQAPNGGCLSQVSNSVASGEYYRRDLDGDASLDAQLDVAAVHEGRYDLVVTPRSSSAVGQPFSLSYTLSNGTSVPLATDIPISEQGYTFPIFPGSESPISPKQGECVRSMRPKFVWQNLFDQPWEKQGGQPVPDLQHEFQLASDPDFNDILASVTVGNGTYTYNGIIYVQDTVSFFWRVRPENYSSWDHVFVFHALPEGLPKDPVITDPEDGVEPGDEGPDGGEFGNNDAIKDLPDGPPIPGSYLLGANYPNPFNPTTTMHIGLPEATHVTLEVFNIVGQKVTTLVDEMMPAGFYDIEWNATAMPSGVYLYRLQAGAFAETRKMVLLK